MKAEHVRNVPFFVRPHVLSAARVSFVHIGGVLLVFSFLVVPAVCATYLTHSIPARFVVGWAIATAASVASLFITARMDSPIGAAIVCVLGLALVLVLMWGKWLRRSQPVG